VTTKKPNPQDATLRDVRALKNAVAKLKADVADLKEWVRLLRRRLQDKKR
jgi:hypothetical protein